VFIHFRDFALLFATLTWRSLFETRLMIILFTSKKH